MPDRVLENLQRINPVGVIALIAAGFVAYGAKFIATVILRVPDDRVFKVIALLKVLGLIIGLFGLYMIARK
ncbi:MAG TPA: hypothetical protein VFD89_07125 [Clostridia bacterium]|nr:hypothetical protein [Clostridia bacterium]